MGILSGLLGNATEVELSDVEKQLENILIEGEKVEKAYKLIRDMFVFTEKRLILIDKQGVTGKKIEYHSIPYSSISHFSVETAGSFDLDSEMNIWISSHDVPLKKQFKKDSNIFNVQKALAYYILK
ncbi:PH domain-containing protein [Longirhabdus pacifica]|uniref:PH domain-containing protein n=1 Tax=Longirhabdus pacifica TaxID=2305227 RepID=UPI001008EB09|nr:PH domain-containing protein [Longirhabdus pacifica]